MTERHTGNDWFMDTEEFAGLMSEMEAQAAQPEADAEHALPTIQDERKAEAHLRAMQYWQSQIDGIDAHAEAEIERIQQWANAEAGKLERKMAWHTRGLKAFCWSSGAKTIRLIAGTLKRRKGRSKVEVEDEMAYNKWALTQENPLEFWTKVEAAKKRISKHIKETGEIPAGTDIKPADDTFSINLPGRPDSDEEE